jgi:hypothetical protein
MHTDPRSLVSRSTLLTAAGARPATSWWAGRPLSEGKVARAVNTREQLAAALASDANWLAGDVRQELHGSVIEMRKDDSRETGDNLTFTEWLLAGKKSGRGLQIDVREPEHMDAIVREVRAANIPSERLSWNLGDAAMGTWAATLRRDFPRAILTISPTGHDEKLSPAQVARMMALAKRGGGPVTFLIRADRVTDSAIRALKGYGTLSVWSATSLARTDVDALRARGVDGIVDAPGAVQTDPHAAKLAQERGRAGDLARALVDRFGD